MVKNAVRRNIELALAGAAHNPASPAAQPSPGPSGVTEQARDVMTAWLVEGPEGAAETLNEIAQTDHGIEATVIGLVNMTAVSLYQVQAVLGHDIHTMVAEMVVQPTDTDG
jgi:hypothetical protein